jgi:hypothetical protein
VDLWVIFFEKKRIYFVRSNHFGLSDSEDAEIRTLDCPIDDFRFEFHFGRLSFVHLTSEFPRKDGRLAIHSDAS